MDFGFSEQEEKFRQEVRDFLDKESPSSWVKGGMWSDGEIESEEEWAFWKSMQRKLAEKGWMGISWPKEYGGLGHPYMEQAIFSEEMGYRGAPGEGAGNFTHFGPALLAWGTEEQKKKYMPPVTRGESIWYDAISEPDAGSDAANIATTAIQDGDDYIINGRKRWGPFAWTCDYFFFFARTDPDSTRHHGLSAFIADLNTPGITMRIIKNMAGYPYWGEITFENVRLPKENMLGPKNQGWTVLTTTFNNERTFMEYFGTMRRNLDLIIRYVKETKRNGEPLARNSVIRHKLAQLAIEVEVTRLLYYRVVWTRDQGITLVHETSLAKAFADKTLKHIVTVGMEIVGLHGQLRPGSKWASLAAKIQNAYLVNPAWALAGGGTEIQKNIVAWMGLKMPREKA